MVQSMDKREYIWMFLTSFANACRGIQAEPGVQSRYSVRTQVYFVIRDFLTAHSYTYSGLLPRLIYRRA